MALENPGKLRIFFLLYGHPVIVYAIVAVVVFCCPLISTDCLIPVSFVMCVKNIIVFVVHDIKEKTWW